MGDPLDPTDPPAGDHCDECWGPGKTFGDKPTPSKIRVSFEGIVSCPGKPPAPNGDYILSQDPHLSCYWQWGDPLVLFAELIYCGTTNTTILTLSYFAGGVEFLWFHSFTTPSCTTDLLNDLKDCPIGRLGHDGTAKIFLSNVEDAQHITYNLGLTQVTEMKKENMTAIGPETVTFIAGYKDNTKCLIKHLPAET